MRLSTRKFHLEIELSNWENEEIYIFQIGFILISPRDLIICYCQRYANSEFATYMSVTCGSETQISFTYKMSNILKSKFLPWQIIDCSNITWPHCVSSLPLGNDRYTGTNGEGDTGKAMGTMGVVCSGWGLGREENEEMRRGGQDDATPDRGLARAQPFRQNSHGRVALGLRLRVDGSGT